MQTATVAVESHIHTDEVFRRSRTRVMSLRSVTLPYVGICVCYISFALAAAVGNLGWSGLMADLFSGPAELLIT